MWSRNIQRIADAEALRWVGFLLAFCHLMTFMYVIPGAVFRLANNAYPQCWQYFPACNVLHFPSQVFWSSYFLVYLILALWGLFLFYRNRISQGFFILMALTALKVFFLVVDRGFMGNYHFMHILYSLVFLFFPNKQWSLQILVAWFYVAAGTLKLNMEWLSGAAAGTSGLAFLPSLLKQWIYAYVVILELFMVYGLFSRWRWIKWLSLAQFLLFHVVSFYWVGYFYPAIMISLLMVFPFSWMGVNSEPMPWRSKPIAVLILILMAFQAVALFDGKDSALHTHRRLLSLNMYDARSLCSTSFYFQGANTTLIYNPNLKPFGVRVRCDASLILNQARNFCLEMGKNPQFKSLDLYLHSRRLTESSFEKIFELNDICPKIAQSTYWQWLTGDL